MNEPDIAPLARRLAEENNVDWRRLEGSGDGGRIVERDVLTFLAKVMAGEEDLDPTPEPVPEGMQAWPDADVAAYRASGSEVPPADRSVTDTLDDDLFLFDEAPGAAADPPDVPQVFDAPVEVLAAVPDADDGLLLVDEPDAAAADVAPIVDDGAGVFAFDDPVVAQAKEPTTPSALPDLFESGPARSTASDSDDALFVVDDGAERDERSVVLDLDDRRAATASAQAVPGDAVARRRADDLADPMEGATDAAERIGDGLGFVIEDPTEAREETAHEPQHVLEAGDVALVRHGRVWRRRVDDRAFRSAVSQAADALGAEPNAVAVALLARAVRRAWPEVGTVGGWTWGDAGERCRTVATDGSFADAVAAWKAPGDPPDGPPAPIVVADLSAIAIDEAVLHLDAPVLALGRATGDGAWLTLSGDDVPRDAVAALGRFAEALASPVRLLV